MPLILPVPFFCVSHHLFMGTERHFADPYSSLSEREQYSFLLQLSAGHLTNTYSPAPQCRRPYSVSPPLFGSILPPPPFLRDAPPPPRPF